MFMLWCSSLPICYECQGSLQELISPPHLTIMKGILLVVTPPNTLCSCIHTRLMSWLHTRSAGGLYPADQQRHLQIISEHDGSRQLCHPALWMKTASAVGQMFTYRAVVCTQPSQQWRSRWELLYKLICWYFNDILHLNLSLCFKLTRSPIAV